MNQKSQISWFYFKVFKPFNLLQNSTHGYRNIKILFFKLPTIKQRSNW